MLHNLHMVERNGMRESHLRRCKSTASLRRRRSANHLVLWLKNLSDLSQSNSHYNPAEVITPRLGSADLDPVICINHSPKKFLAELIKIVVIFIPKSLSSLQSRTVLKVETFTVPIWFEVLHSKWIRNKRNKQIIRTNIIHYIFPMPLVPFTYKLPGRCIIKRPSYIGC